MTSLIAVYAFAGVMVAPAIGVVGLVVITTHDIRRTIRRGIGDR
jgi:hypothetical protein